jgi:uncharacterized protein
MNPVVHFEMPYENRDRMVDFYAKAFGWESKLYGPEMGNYVVAITAEHGEDGMPIKPGMINGGFYQKIDDPISHHPSVVIAVEDIREAMKKVAESGGKVIGGGNKKGEPDDIPDVGLYISILDTEGNRVGMLQPKPMSK